MKIKLVDESEEQKPVTKEEIVNQVEEIINKLDPPKPYPVHDLPKPKSNGGTVIAVVIIVVVVVVLIILAFVAYGKKKEEQPG